DLVAVRVQNEDGVHPACVDVHVDIGGRAVRQRLQAQWPAARVDVDVVGGGGKGDLIGDHLLAGHGHAQLHDLGGRLHDAHLRLAGRWAHQVIRQDAQAEVRVVTD